MSRLVGSTGVRRDTLGEVEGVLMAAQLCLPLAEPSNFIKYQLLTKMQQFSRCCLPPQMEVHLSDGHSISRASNL